MRLKNRNDINLKTLFSGTSLNIISGFWLITLTVQLYFFIATLKVWIYYNLQLLHTLCILIHLLMQPSGFVLTKKCQLKVLQSIFTVFSLLVLNSREWPRKILFLLKISIQYQAAAFSRPRSQFFTIRTDTKPVNYIFIFLRLDEIPS